MRTIIRYQNKKPNLPLLQVPGWAGDETNEQYQPWHDQMFIDAATAGIELVYCGESATIEDKITKPFVEISDKFYMLETEFSLETPDGYNLFIIPHYRYYSDLEAPLPLMYSIEADWYPNKLSVVFRKTGKTIFNDGEPYAQAIVTPRGRYDVVELSKEEKEGKKQAIKYIEGNKDKYLTREWKTSFGVIQDNLYNVLAHLQKKNELPKEIKSPRKKLRIFKR